MHSLSDSGHVDAMGVASSPHRHLMNLHGCITVLARRHYPGMGTGDQMIRVHAGAEVEVPKQLFKVSSWLHMAKGSECSINHDRPEVPPTPHPQCFPKPRAWGTMVQASQGSFMEGLEEIERSTLVPW